MTKKIIKGRLFTLACLIMALPSSGQGLVSTYEKSNHLETSTYEEGMAFFHALAEKHPEVQLIEEGPTDSGYPLNVVLISRSKNFDIQQLKNEGKAVFLINNAIHAGEPDGVEASQMLARDLLENKKMSRLLDNTVIAIIPFYNIGGVLNRNSGSRVNQNGPKEYGFRGNARNFDLNRDFIKTDTRNARSFSELFQKLDPDVFVDTHVSNGADYQYVATTIATQNDKLGGPLADYMKKEMLPFHYEFMKEAGTEMTPYVNIWGMSTPDMGYSEFIDLPRYSSGYAALFNTPGFISETHMLKTFEQRVEATYNYLLGLITFTNTNGKEIINLRNETKRQIAEQKEFVVSWKLNDKECDSILFKGYEAERPVSEITGQVRLKYDRARPYEKKIAYYNHYDPDVTVSRPDYYVVPKGQWPVIERLKWNNIEMEVVKEAREITVEVYHIVSFKTQKQPFEGHYMHYDVEVEARKELVQLEPGDLLVPVNQWRNRYIVETLEPQASDSFFNWNFFDTILQRKEGFSAYVFEDLALEILEQHPEIKEALEVKKKEDIEFAQNGYAQLMFIYEHSNHNEKAYMRYPIYRYLKQ